MTKNEMIAFRCGRLVAHLVLVMIGFTTVALAVNACIPKYSASYSADSKTLVVKTPNGDRIELVGIVNSTNTHPTFRLHNVGYMRRERDIGASEFITNVIMTAALDPVYDTNSALSVYNAFFTEANKQLSRREE